MDNRLLNPTIPICGGDCTFPFTIFPDEIILEILIRLPPKSICRLKCLSKYWLSFICSPNFLKAYLTLSPPQPPSWILVDRGGRISRGTSPDIFFSLSQPPNLTYLTLSGLSPLLTKSDPPIILTCSNGLILFALELFKLLYICNPVTRDWAPLPVPNCGKITSLPHVALSAKFTPNCDDVSLVVIELQLSPKEDTLLTYRSVTGQWEATPARIRRRRKTQQNTRWAGSFEVKGKLFWVELSCGLIILDDPFGESLELRFISLPSDQTGLVFPVNEFVQCFVNRERGAEIWRLNDVEKGKWGLLYEVDMDFSEIDGMGGRRLSAFHALDVDFSYWIGGDKVAVVNMRKGKMVEIVTYRKNVEDLECFLPVVLPSWPTPLPLRLRELSPNPSEKSISCLPTAHKMDHRLVNPTDPICDGGDTFPFTIFPDKIILEILIRLPPKSICRLKCLSKYWLLFICSPDFLSAYLTLSPPQPPSWILMDRVGRFSPGPGPSQNLSSSLSQPPKIAYLTLWGLPSHQPGAPIFINSSNGLVLFTLPPSNDLYICNPVTRDWALLPVPDCGKITTIPHVSLAAKFSPTYDDVSLVIIEFQSSPKEDTLLTYRSSTGKWEVRPAEIRGRKKTQQHSCLSFEVKGKLFWADNSCGLIILDDPFGERLELRFIPLPQANCAGSGSAFPVGDFVHCLVKMKKHWRLWRLNDEEKGKWGLLYKVDADFRKIGLPDMGYLRLSAFHALDVDVTYWTAEGKVVVLNLRKWEVVEIVSYPKNAVRQYNYLPVVLPSWPTPLPLRLRATSAKEKGNINFQLKNFKNALVNYSRSISCLPTAAAYANRAATKLQLGKYQEAENDCSEALKLDDQYLKVYIRRAKARKELGKLLKARDDVEMALKLDGGQNQELLKLSSQIYCLLEKEAIKTEEDG